MSRLHFETISETQVLRLSTTMADYARIESSPIVQQVGTIMSGDAGQSGDLYKLNLD